MKLKSLAGAAAFSALMLPPAFATEAGDLTRAALYSGKFSDGIVALAPLVEAGDQEAVFGTALIRFVRGLETVAFQLHTYGLTAPRVGPMGEAVFGPPGFAIPLPANPDPSPLTYEAVRGILEAIEFNLGSNEEGFLKAAESGDYVLMIDPLKVRIDANGDGVASDSETVAAVFQQALGLSELAPAPTPTPQAADRPTASPTQRSRGQRPRTPPAGSGPAASAVDATIGFDRADAYWLAGYTNIVLAQVDFLLAHDFSTLVNASFHRLFPNSGLPMQDYARGGMLVMDPETDTALADAIAAIHSLNWPVIDADRLKSAHQRMKKVITLSRQNWAAILAETDDQRELVPSPRQTSILPEGRVTQEVVDAWLATLDTFERILDGELLVPHWRFRQGFDLKAYFETAQRTDFVMLMTGYDALPYLKDGPVADAESFAEGNRVFGNDFLNYIFWFN